MGCWGYIRFAGKPANNLLKRFGYSTVEFYVRCCQRVRRQLAPQYACPCDLLVMSMAIDHSREESEVFTPPLLPAPRQASQSSSLSSFHSSSTDIGDRDGGSGCTHSGSLSDVEAEPWFFNISRREAEVYLRKCADGTYLVRPSRKGGHGSICTLNVQFGGRVYHVLVQRRDDGNVGLGTEKEGEETFTSIVELVEYYQEKRLQLFSNGNLVGTTALTCYFKSPA